MRPLRASLNVSHGRLLSRKLIHCKTTTRRVNASSSSPDYQLELRKTGCGIHYDLLWPAVTCGRDSTWLHLALTVQ